MSILLLRGVAAIAGVLVLIGAMSVSPGATLSAHDSELPELERSLGEAIDEAGVPGAAIAVVEPDRMRTGVVGTDAHGRSLDVDAQMLWGSVAKPLAATAVLKLVEEGALDLDDSVIDHVPELDRQRDPSIRSITIRQLLNHTSGLPFGGDSLDIDDPSRSPRAVVAELPQMDLQAQPGQRYSYSSLGYLLIQAVAEEAGGSDLEDLESQFFPGVGNVDELSPGSRFIGDSAVSWPSPRDGAGIGYGYQGGSVRALGSFVQSRLVGDGSEVLDEMTDKAVDAGDSGAMGLGWRVRDDGVVWHTGTVPGYFSAVHIDRERGVGVVLTLNASGLFHEEEMLSIAQNLFDEARGGAGDDAAHADSSIPGLIVIVTFVLAALIVGLGLLIRARRSFAFFWLAASLAAVCVGWWVIPDLFDAPARYAWLWMPDVGFAFVLIPALLLGVGIWWWVRPAPTPWLSSRRLDLDAAQG